MCGIDGGEGFVEQDHRAVLQQGAGEEGALELAGGEAADRALARSRSRPTASSAWAAAARMARADAAEDADPAPMAELDRIEDRDREAAIDVGLLRQVGDLGAPDAAPSSMRPASGRSSPTMAFSSVVLPAPLGPTMAVSEPGPKLPLR